MAGMFRSAHVDCHNHFIESRQVDDKIVRTSQWRPIGTVEQVPHQARIVHLFDCKAQAPDEQKAATAARASGFGGTY